jgi:hypothetical protein
VGQRAVSARWPGGVGCCVSLPVGGRGLALCPVSRSARTTGGRIEDGRTVSRTGSLQADTTGPARCRSLQDRPGAFLALSRYCYTAFLALPALWPCRASLLPCTALSRPGWASALGRSLPLPCGASLGLWRAGVGLVGTAGGRAVSIWGGRRARCYSSAVAFDLCPASCLGLSDCRAVSACFGPSGASSVCVWCPVVVWCFSSSTGQKKNGPVWVVSPWVVWWCL